VSKREIDDTLENAQQRAGEGADSAIEGAGEAGQSRMQRHNGEHAGDSRAHVA
jgi:hypothetical protein